ncbi:MAG: TonB-dependent receptor [Maribacter sp.]|nr:TonB-dependent receptor [Maribacter sp.]
MKITLLRSLLVIGAFLCFGSTQAQEVSGSVRDANGPLPGASVVVKGTTNGTQTDFDGLFALNNVADDATLVISYIGYKTVEVAVAGKTTIDVTLEEDAEALQEVVVTGYGSQAKKEITSSITKVGEEEFNKGVVNTAANLLQGKVAGLTIYNKGGNPNVDPVVRLRGISTVGANSSPLVVIDGVVGASLNNVDPNDIESITVLKDGSAAAIYGTRGSSGVILVTTKSGKVGAVKVEYNGQLAVSSRAHLLPVMSADEFVAAGGVDLGSKTDWLDEVTINGSSKINNVAVSGGDGNSTYRVSGNFREEQGILYNSGFKQYNTRANVSTRTFNDKLRIDFDASYTKRNSNFSFNEGLRYGLLYNPTAPIYAVDSPFPFDGASYGGYFETLGLFDSFNPVSIVKQSTNLGTRDEFVYSANFNYDILDNWDVNVLFSQQTSKSNAKGYSPTTALYLGNATSPIRKGLAQLYSEERNFKLFEAYTTYNTNFAQRVNLSVTAGYSWQQQNQFNYFLSAGGFPNNALQYVNALQWSSDLDNAGFANYNSNEWPDDRIIAYFARASATFDDAIFFNASVRREGSSRFGVDNKWGTFPAVGVGADLNHYLKLTNVDLLKVRLGYGVTGALPPTFSLSQNQYVDNGSRLAAVPAFQANPDLKWEEKAETNFGIEFASGRLNATLDLYTRNVRDFILATTIENLQGFDSQYQNAGRMQTNGMELAVNYDVIKRDKISYNTGINFSTYSTVLKEFTTPQQVIADLGSPGQNSTAMIRVAVGEKIGQIWGPVFTGEVVDGSQVLADVNGDGVLNTGQDQALAEDGDFADLGSGIPDFELGWTNQLSIGKFDVNAFFRGAFGHSLINTFRAFYEPRVGSQGSYNFVNTKYANPEITNAQYSSLYVEKADFFRLDNLSIGYTFDIKENKYIKGVRLTASGQNLFTITSYTGADPEPQLVDIGETGIGAFGALGSNPLAPGIDRRNNYFAARTFTLGLNLNF